MKSTPFSPKKHRKAQALSNRGDRKHKLSKAFYIPASPTWTFSETTPSAQVKQPRGNSDTGSITDGLTICLVGFGVTQQLEQAKQNQKQQKNLSGRTREPPLVQSRMYDSEYEEEVRKKAVMNEVLPDAKMWKEWEATEAKLRQGRGWFPALDRHFLELLVISEIACLSHPLQSFGIPDPSADRIHRHATRVRRVACERIGAERLHAYCERVKEAFEAYMSGEWGMGGVNDSAVGLEYGSEAGSPHMSRSPSPSASLGDSDSEIAEHGDDDDDDDDEGGVDGKVAPEELALNEEDRDSRTPGDDWVSGRGRGMERRGSIARNDHSPDPASPKLKSASNRSTDNLSVSTRNARIDLEAGTKGRFGPVNAEDLGLKINLDATLDPDSEVGNEKDHHRSPPGSVSPTSPLSEIDDMISGLDTDTDTASVFSFTSDVSGLSSSSLSFGGSEYLDLEAMKVDLEGVEEVDETGLEEAMEVERGEVVSGSKGVAGVALKDAKDKVQDIVRKLEEQVHGNVEENM